MSPHSWWGWHSAVCTYLTYWPTFIWTCLCVGKYSDHHPSCFTEGIAKPTYFLGERSVTWGYYVLNPHSIENIFKYPNILGRKRRLVARIWGQDLLAGIKCPGKTVQKDLLCRGLGLIWSLEEKGALSALPEAAWISHWESQYSEPHVC